MMYIGAWGMREAEGPFLAHTFPDGDHSATLDKNTSGGVTCLEHEPLRAGLKPGSSLILMNCLPEQHSEHSHG